MNVNELNVTSYVQEHNAMVEASYKLSAIEQKLIIAMASMINADDTEFKTYKLRISDFMDFIDSTDQNKYRELPIVTKGLMRKVMTIHTNESDILQVAWLSSAEYKRKQGILELEFSPKLKPYLLQLKEEVSTRYRLDNIGRLKSSYSIRLYRLLKEYFLKNELTHSFDLEALRTIFAIEPNEYKLYGHFKDKILLPSQEELKEKTDLRFEFKETRIRRKVISITFDIFQNEPECLQDSEAQGKEKIS